MPLTLRDTHMINAKSSYRAKPTWINPLYLFAALLMTSNTAYADAISNVQNYTDQQFASTAKLMAEAVSRSAPAQIDNVTTLLGAVYLPDYKIFQYRYESTTPLNHQKGQKYLEKHTCSDPLRRAYMSRGMIFKHVYYTPTGQVTFTVSRSSCAN